MATPTEHDREVRNLAELLIARHGESATSFAVHQSLKAAQRGDQRRMEAWRWIADAAEQVWRLEPAAVEE